MTVGETMSKSFGQKLKDFRLDKGMSQTELAVDIGISLGTVVRIEQGGDISELIERKVQNYLKEQAA
jgi:transcriptional regulator with XRE-family HTH domain